MKLNKPFFTVAKKRQRFVRYTGIIDLFFSPLIPSNYLKQVDGMLSVLIHLLAERTRSISNNLSHTDSQLRSVPCTLHSSYNNIIIEFKLELHVFRTSS